MQCTWSSAVPCVSSSSAMARSWAAKNLQFLPVLWVLPDSASSGSNHALISSCYVPWQSMSISSISLAISWLRGSHTRRLDNESTRYIHGKLRLSTLFSKALLIEALVLITVCFKRRTPQGRMELHCLCIVSALCLQVSGQKPFVSLLSCEKAAAVMYISWCLSIAIYCLGVFCLQYTLYSYLFVQLVFHHTEFSAAPPTGGPLPPSPPVLRPFCSPGQWPRSKDRLESLPDKLNCNKIHWGTEHCMDCQWKILESCHCPGWRSVWSHKYA